MKYPETIYSNFEHFFAQAIEIAKDKVGLFNSLVAPPVRKQIQSNSFQQFLYSIIYILKKAGWYIYLAIGGLLGLGVIAFFGGIGALIAANPVIAAALAALGGSSVYLLWKHKDFVIASRKIGKRYKEDFDSIVNKYPEKSNREEEINPLLSKCVKSLCIECFQANSDAFIEQLEKEEF